MSSMSFLVPQRDKLPPRALARAYVAGLDDVPWQCQTRENPAGFMIRFADDQSGRLHIPWRVGIGEWVLSTSNLPPRDAPYHLPVELARGTLTRLRNELCAWEANGFVPSGEVRNLVGSMQRCFSRAAIGQNNVEQSANDAEEALGIAWDVIELLGIQSARLSARRTSIGAPQLALGINIGTEAAPPAMLQEVALTFSAVQIPVNWRIIEPLEGDRDWTSVDRAFAWAESRRLPVCLGPLLQFDRQHVPDWLYLWNDDEAGLAKIVDDFLRAVVQRYRDRARIWICAARINVPGALTLQEDQRLQLAITTVEAIRSARPDAGIILSLDQPWAEFMGHAPSDLPPIYFADALLRTETGLSAIGLEINLGYTLPGTDARDILDISRQLDRWSSLERPLFIFLTTPSSTKPDKLAAVNATPLVMSPSGESTPETQARLVEQLIPLFISKPSVQALFWNQLSDHLPHDFARGGLFDSQQRPKPLLAKLRDLRKRLGF